MASTASEIIALARLHSRDSGMKGLIGRSRSIAKASLRDMRERDGRWRPGGYLELRLPRDNGRDIREAFGIIKKPFRGMLGVT